MTNLEKLARDMERTFKEQEASSSLINEWLLGTWDLLERYFEVVGDETNIWDYVEGDHGPDVARVAELQGDVLMFAAAVRKFDPGEKA